MMVRVMIAIVNTKGGVGKTTSAIYMATALAELGNTLLWDADHQASATDWAQYAEESEDPLPFPVEPANLSTLRRGAPAGFDYVVIDTPPGDPRTLDAAIAASDVVVLPTEAAPQDMSRLWVTLEHLDENKKRVVLLTKTAPHTKAHRAAVDVLNEAQVPLFEADIPRREEVKNSFGLRPRNLFTYPAVVAELLEEIK